MLSALILESSLISSNNEPILFLFSVFYKFSNIFIAIKKTNKGLIDTKTMTTKLNIVENPSVPLSKLI